MSRFANKGQLQELYDYMGGLISVPQLVQHFQSGDIYSEEERMIGRWIDGKPLYQKVIQFNTSTTPISSGTYTIPHNISDLDNAINIYGILNNSSAKEIDPIPTTWGTSNLATVVIRGDNVQVRTYNSNISGSIVSVIIKYTKTTDDATSYRLASPYDYSTNETIIGSWIDGSPVYQRTWTGLNIPCAWTKLGFVLADNIDTYITDIDFNKVIQARIDKLICPNGVDNYGVPASIVYFSTVKQLIFVASLSSQGDYINAVTLQYTK